MTTAIAPKEMERWEVIVPRFASDIYAKYPSLENGWTETLVTEIKALGLAKEYISQKSLWAAFRNCVAEGTIVLPVQPKVDVVEASARLAAAFPPVVKRIRKEANGDLVNSQSGRMTHSERQAQSTKSSRDAAIVRTLSNLAELKMEYRALRAKAETAMDEKRPQSHAANYSERKRLLAELNSNPRFAEVRDQS